LLRALKLDVEFWNYNSRNVCCWKLKSGFECCCTILIVE
jgi:hypothetical protein